MAKHSLIVRKGKVLFSSVRTGLVPLILASRKLRGRRGCTVHDKVVGLAAAKIIVHTGFAVKVVTPVCSRSAASYLKGKGIVLEAGQVVSHIMNRERSGVCPMESMASRMSPAKIFSHVARFSKNY